jgi:hypothetical protein
VPLGIGFDPPAKVAIGVNRRLQIILSFEVEAHVPETGSL